MKCAVFVEHKTEKMQKIVQKKSKKSNARIHYIQLYPKIISEDKTYLISKLYLIKK